METLFAMALKENASPQRASRKVCQERLWRRHMEMAEIGSLGDGGVDRQAFTEEDRAARKLLISWAGERGYGAGIDAIGNLYLRRCGTDASLAPVMTGSHMDTQPQGGRFDGIYGVLAGLEALDAMEDAAVATARPIDVVAWSNEEGCRYEPGTMGSLAFTGRLRPEELSGLTDARGIAFSDALSDTLRSTPGLETREFGAPVAYFIEAHIEQGPVLEELRIPIGVVEGIQGVRWMNVTVHGTGGHAGTVPLKRREDAMQGAVRAIQALNELMDDPDDLVRFTVGRLDAVPNSPNTIASEVTFSVDFRHPDQNVLKSRGDDIHSVCKRAALPCRASIDESLSVMPADFDSRVMDVLAEAAAGLDIPNTRMSSGAFHDALNMSRVCPSGMLFVPCEKGISHSPAENAKPEDLAAGAMVLADALVALANQGR